ncbi:NADH-quinone oxidoreductase subunit C 1 [Lacunisphaera limnophila]|uniref:NADH-quinone oxidoreductase subunit C n=1 Tax=Lacunisphaera limnophila TaxID=1838286 RepID=A0A1D8AUQ9_9BACT|nr:NADH-quinone oxidoreductase subunit C [Lacunisphaera limnophila]AOS44637.1 NADH-quinone oxidoreductase subunit C 1 [Lacunisphaera limnophila]
MTTDVAITTAVAQQFPSTTPRASLDCPAFNVPAAEALALLQYLRDAQGYDFLMDLTAVDWSAEQSPRFTVVWHLYSSTKHCYVRVAAACPADADPAMPTATGLWAGADWHERETYDMLGIKFTGHPDLRRILMWDGYPYFPLRKEFPLAGLPTEMSDAEINEEIKVGVISAPMAGGPFVATPGEPMSEAEPRAKDEAWNEKKEKPE